MLFVGSGVLSLAGFVLQNVGNFVVCAERGCVGVSVGNRFCIFVAAGTHHRYICVLYV